MSYSLIKHSLHYFDIPVISEQPDGDFFLLADDYRNEIYIATSNFSIISAIPLPEKVRPLGLAYDWIRRHVYFSDFSRGILYRCNMDGSQLTPLWYFGRGKIITVF